MTRTKAAGVLLGVVLFMFGASAFLWADGAVRVLLVVVLFPLGVLVATMSGARRSD